MSRSLRIEFSGAIYHITSRGNAKGPIFYDDNDKKYFLNILGDVTERYDLICHSYCLMSNHYHLLIETPEPNLSRALQQLNGTYGARFNKVHVRVGHLFQGRYKSIIVDREEYLLELCRYIVLNPVRAKIVTKPEDYFWSSYRAIVGLQKRPEFLTTDWILSQFEEQPALARKKYSEFIHAGIDGINPWHKLRGQIILGKETFLQTLEKLIEEKAQISEIPQAQRFVAKSPSPNVIILAKNAPNKKQRDELICELYYKNKLPVNKVAKTFSLHPSTISKIIHHPHQYPS